VRISFRWPKRPRTSLVTMSGEDHKHQNENSARESRGLRSAKLGESQGKRGEK
jgi:hypothetical protein